LSRAGYKLSDKHYEIAKECGQDLDELLAKVDFIEEQMTPIEFEDFMHEYARKHGHIDYDDDDGRPRYRCYIPNDEEEINLFLINNIGLVKDSDYNGNKKEAINKLSERLLWAKNRFKFTFIVAQDFNNDMLRTTKFKRNGAEPSDIIPHSKDLKDTSQTYIDADIVLGMVKPVDYGIRNYMGYYVMSDGDDLDVIGSYLTILYLMKDSYGIPNVEIPLNNFPRVSKFREMPSSTDFGMGTYLYEDFVNSKVDHPLPKEGNINSNKFV
jgi:hypothetical protein